MSLVWPSERVSRVGLVEFAVAATSLVAGDVVLRRMGRQYMAPGAMMTLVAGLAALVVCGVAVFRIVRRREYPWVLALAAVALPLYEPSQAPYGVGDRIAMGIRDLALVGLAVLFLTRILRRADELERRIHLEALSWSYSAVIVLLLAHAMVEDALPPIRGTWVASAMLGSWVIAWLGASARYQR